MYIEYESNNSGGSWWLSDDDWKALEKAGWKVKWSSLEQLFNDEGYYVRDADGTPTLVPIGEGTSEFGSSATPDDNGEYRWLGALATKAWRCGLSLKDAVAEWEKVTGQSSEAAGCPCCGQPHTFTEYDDDNKYVTS
jgi:hypothetical protein